MVRVRMQQQLCGCFCRLCCGALPSDRHHLYRAYSLTKAGTLLSNITGEDLSVEAECAPQICKSCYNRLGAIAKEEEELQKKHQLLVRTREEVCSSMICRHY